MDETRPLYTNHTTIQVFLFNGLPSRKTNTRSSPASLFVNEAPQRGAKNTHVQMFSPARGFCPIGILATKRTNTNRPIPFDKCRLDKNPEHAEQLSRKYDYGA